MQKLQAQCLTLHVTVVEDLQGSSSVGVFAEVQQVSISATANLLEVFLSHGS